MVSRAVNDKFDSWQLKELNFPRSKDSENYEAPWLPLVNLSLIALETMPLLVLTLENNEYAGCQKDVFVFGMIPLIRTMSYIPQKLKFSRVLFFFSDFLLAFSRDQVETFFLKLC